MDLTFPSSHESSGLLRVALRAAFLHTFQHLLDDFESNRAPRTSPGFLSQVPIAAGCATQVQLDVLFRTWRRIRSGHSELTALDQCICFYAVGELARLGEVDDHFLIERANDSTGMVDIEDHTWLASRLRTIQIMWPFPVDAAVLQRNVSLLMADADRAAVIDRQPSLADEFLELIGEWTVSTEIVKNSEGLLTPEETQQLGKFFSEHPQLMNL
jgi:hypothetical protein